jgi:AraC-like DNA-binding protein
MDPGLPPVHFTFWTVVLLIAAGQGAFFGTLLLLGGRGNRSAERLLGLIVLVFTLTLFDYLGFWTRWNYRFPHIAFSYVWLAFLPGPLYYLYLVSLFQGKGPGRRQLPHFIPALATLLLFLPLYLASATEKVGFFTGEGHYSLLLGLHPGLGFRAAAILTVIQLLVYGGLSLWLVRRHSLPETLDRRYMNATLLLFGGYVAAYVFYYAIIKTPLFTLLLDYSITLAMVVFIYTLAYLGYRRPAIFQGKAMGRLFAIEKYQTSALTAGAVDGLLGRLEYLMQTGEAYLDNELRLPKLAERLNASPHHLSQVINDRLGMSFPAYVNTYRLKKAKALLLDPRQSEHTVLEIAYASGFNNKTTFNKLFKEATGMSPTAYRKASTFIKSVDNGQQTAHLAP